ncbi:MAG: phospholipase D-like domain-containing protein [Candidatus Woesearchaeota archaeon]|nr:phospholipase D-like domain-containing protein [Candidatus Woesearchaeota archaeon]
MMVSQEIIELAEKIKNYRTDMKLVEELKIKKEALENQVAELEKSIKILKLNTMEQNKLLEQLKELETDKKKLKLDLEKSKEAYTFVVTTPSEASNTVYGEISRELSKAQQEILISSPWITHIIDELSSFKKKDDKNKVNIKVITRLIREDIEKGVTDLDKLRALKDTFDAEIRYNNDLHAKMVIIDNSVAIISSANLTKKGLSVNYEAGICLRDKNMVNKIAQFFNDIWKESKPLTPQAIENVLSNQKG